MFDISMYIPTGKENAITRSELARILGLTDRQTRKLIEEARDRGELICNEGSGYFYATEVGQIERQYKTDRARALSTLKRLKAMRRYLRENGRKVK